MSTNGNVGTLLHQISHCSCDHMQGNSDHSVKTAGQGISLVLQIFIFSYLLLFLGNGDVAFWKSDSKNSPSGMTNTITIVSPTFIVSSSMAISFAFCHFLNCFLKIVSFGILNSKSHRVIMCSTNITNTIFWVRVFTKKSCTTYRTTRRSRSIAMVMNHDINLLVNVLPKQHYQISQKKQSSCKSSSPILGKSK